ncbi:MAG: 5' nucleotidase, NT5C type [Microthrixaceae bacterium]
MDGDFVLGVDLDGVCADYTAAFREVVARRTGTAAHVLTDDVSWDFAEWGLDRDAFLDLHRAGVMEDRMFRDMPALPGVADALWRLSDAGVWIRIITHRLVLNWGHEVVVADTVAWLDRHRIPYRDLCFLGRKPEVQADAYVEDAPHNVEALRAGGNVVVVFDQPYNRHLGGPRARDWHEVEAVLAEPLAARIDGFQGQLPGVPSGADRLDRHRGGS